MYILHIETATKVCSVALSRDAELLGWEEVDEGMNHAALLAPMISRLLDRQRVKPVDLGAISVSSGPGSYTGLRVGGSTAKAMAYSLRIPLISLPTLLALASAASISHPGAQYLLPMLDARRDEVYTCLFSHDLSPQWKISAVHVNQAFWDSLTGLKGEILLCGDGAFKAADLSHHLILIDSSITCSARHLVKPAYGKWLEKELADPLHFVPDYLKPPNITQPKILNLP